MKDLITELAARMKSDVFRAKRKDNNEWIEGYLAAYDLICPDYPEDVSDAMGTYYSETPFVGFVEVHPETVCLASKLTDKNNKKIYEWDILRNSSGTPFVAIREKEARFLGFTIEKESRIMYVGREPKAEVIGNVFDNSDMLNDSVIEKILERSAD